MLLKYLYHAFDTLNVVVSGLGINYSTGVYPSTVYDNTEYDCNNFEYPPIGTAGVNAN